jgi:hypothetical protein
MLNEKVFSMFVVMLRASCCSHSLNPLHFFGHLAGFLELYGLSVFEKVSYVSELIERS